MLERILTWTPRVIAVLLGLLGLRALVAGVMESDPFQFVPGALALVVSVGTWRGNRFAMVVTAFLLAGHAMTNVQELLVADMPIKGGRVLSPSERSLRKAIWAAQVVGFGGAAALVMLARSRQTRAR